MQIMRIRSIRCRGERRSPISPQTGASKSRIDQGEGRSPLQPSATYSACRVSLNLAPSPPGEGCPFPG